MLTWMLLQMDYQEKIEKYIKQHPNARKLGKKECINSGVCCMRRPGELSKQDLKRLSAHFNMTEAEFFKEYCMADKLRGNYTVILRRKHQPGGTWVSLEESYSTETSCVFHSGSGCDIHDIKPAMCKAQKCWATSTTKLDKDDEYFRNKNDIIALGWDGIEDFD